jgi:hypothetical protein
MGHYLLELLLLVPEAVLLLVLALVAGVVLVVVVVLVGGVELLPLGGSRRRSGWCRRTRSSPSVISSSPCGTMQGA